jgi:hypothetical protein
MGLSKPAKQAKKYISKMMVTEFNNQIQPEFKVLIDKRLFRSVFQYLSSPKHHGF